MAVAYCEITMILGSWATPSAWSWSGASHQSALPLRSAAIAEKGSKVSHSIRSKWAIFGPEVSPPGLPRGVGKGGTARKRRGRR
jgi:hypothetical protein